SSLENSTISNSYPTLSSNGSATIFNQNTDGSSSQITLDPRLKPISKIFLNQEGQNIGDTLLLDSSDQVTITSQNGITIQTIQKSTGSIIQSFKDENNN